MTNNPLIEKYNELYPPKNPYSHLRYEDVCLIRTLERMVEDLKRDITFLYCSMIVCMEEKE